MHRDLGLYGIDWDLYIALPLMLFIGVSLWIGRVQSDRRRVTRRHEQRVDDFYEALAEEEREFRLGIRREILRSRREEARAAVDEWFRLRAERGAQRA